MISTIFTTDYSHDYSYDHNNNSSSSNNKNIDADADHEVMIIKAGSRYHVQDKKDLLVADQSDAVSMRDHHKVSSLAV